MCDIIDILQFRIKRKSYEERMEKTENKLLRKLFKIMIEKKSNLCVAVNLKSIDETLKFIDQIGNHVCMIKVQINRYGLNKLDFVKQLFDKKKKYNFILFEDAKLGDTPETVAEYYQGGELVKYFDMITVHPNELAILALQKIVFDAELPEDEPRGLFGLCEFSYERLDITEKRIRFNKVVRHSGFCCGIIAQSINVHDPYKIIRASPGVHLSRTGDGQGQKWSHPSKVIASGADIVIVGRGIVSAPSEELLATTILYKEACWQAYLDDLKR